MFKAGPFRYQKMPLAECSKKRMLFYYTPHGLEQR